MFASEDGEDSISFSVMSEEEGTPLTPAASSRNYGGATLSVFFEGTSMSVGPPWQTQVGLFATLVDAPTVTWGFGQRSLNGDRKHFKMAFDGCGVAFGGRGTIFAHGLKKQCRLVIERVEEMQEAGLGPVRVVCLGQSRGGMAIMILARMMAQHPNVEIHGLIFDPVPGNLLFTAKLFDWLGVTVANSNMDLSHCDALKRVLVLYPHEPLPSLACHAPIVPHYPAACEVEEDVTLGCHQGALFNPGGRKLDCQLSYLRIDNFLRESGVPVQKELIINERAVLRGLQAELQKNRPTWRRGHGPNGCAIVRQENGDFLNRHHEELAKKHGEFPSEAPLGLGNMLCIEREVPTWKLIEAQVVVIVGVVLAVLSFIIGPSMS